MSLRALGGGELFGDRLVRIVYLDESGTSVHEPFTVVAGVIVHGDHQLTKLKRALDAVMKKHIPEKDRDSLVLHTCDIYGGNKYFDKRRKPEWDWDRRKALLDDLARIPVDLNLYVTWGPIEKNAFPAARLREDEPLADDLELSVGAAFLVCLFEVDLWFRQNARRENCFIIAEDNRDTRQFIKSMQQQHQDKSILDRPGVMDEDREYLPLRHIHEDPSFQEKKVAHPLILADFIAFFMKRRMMNDTRSFQFSDPFLSRIAAHHSRLPPRPEPF